MTITEELQENTSITIPYLKNKQVAVIRIEDKAKYTSTEDMKDEYTFVSSEGQNVKRTINQHLSSPLNNGDWDLMTYLLGAFTDKDTMRKSLMSIQNAFNDPKHVEGKLGGSMTIDDCMFSQSGIASIGIDTMFNGSFLYNGSPAMISVLMQKLSNVQSISGNNLAGMSYPVEVNITGNTKFYDYKTQEQMDISGLITENMTKIASGLPIDTDVLNDLDIDKIFPMKSYLFRGASNQKATISKEGKTYINVPVAFYGGGLNLSTVNIDTLDNKAKMTGNFKVDLLDSYLNQPGTSYDELMTIVNDMLNGKDVNIGELMPVFKGLVLKCVTVVIGYEPFEFICYKSDDLYGQVPQYSDLIYNLKGDKENENN